MNPDTLEDRLAELSDLSYDGAQPPADLAAWVLDRYRRRRRAQMLGAVGSVVLVVAGVVVVGVSIGHVGGATTTPRPLSSSTRQPPAGVGRHGNHLVYAVPGTSIPLTHNGITIWRSPKLPASDGLPGAGVFGGHPIPAAAGPVDLQVRPVITHDQTWLRVKLTASRRTATARFVIGKASYELAPRQGQITGRFLAIGGPAGATPAPQRGHVALRAKGQTGLNITVGPNGRFSATLPAATYRLSGRSPQFVINGHQATCNALHPVRIEAHKTTRADVYCQRR